MRAASIGLALAACATLPGCIAAALPIVAGGAIAGTQMKEDDAGLGAARISSASAAAALSPGVTVLEGITELPRPSDVRSEGASSLPLEEYVDAQLSSDAPRSAMLRDPSRLRPERMPCEQRQPVLLLDLDPGDGVAPLDGAEPADAALSSMLASLRGRGVAIAWITDRAPQEAGALRLRLRQAGLDPQGGDPLFVMRYPGESKQERRRALGRTHCVLAIAGDGREDFDDLYRHLRDPATALQLESMLGQGWFLIANPLD